MKYFQYLSLFFSSLFYISLFILFIIPSWGWSEPGHIRLLSMALFIFPILAVLFFLPHFVHLFRLKHWGRLFFLSGLLLIPAFLFILFIIFLISIAFGPPS
jgi:hypothetical protein